MSIFKNQSYLLRHHLSAVAVSILLNIGLFVLLITFITFSEPGSDNDRIVTVIEQNEPLDEIEEIEEIIEPEEPDPLETTDEINVNMENMLAESLDTSIPQEEVMIASPVASPVIMEGLAAAMSGLSRDGMIGEGSGTTFMGQKARGNRFAFIIDYSKSMDETQLAVMKHELTNALAAIGETGLATVLFFSGPVWRPDEDAKEAARRWKGDNSTTNWRLKEGEEGPRPQWLIPNRKNMAVLQRMIYQTPTIGGTDWYPPMKEVLGMQPRPDIIFFMTDGRTSTDSTDKTIELVKSVRREIQVNTVALGVREDDVSALKELAVLTGGKFRRYSKEELREVNQNLPKAPTEFKEGDLDYLSGVEVATRTKQQVRKKAPPPEEKDLISFEID